LKLAPLLAQFLYTHKKLQLTGLGTFSFDGTISSEPDTSKHNKIFTPAGITFETNPNTKDDENLIAFIASQTGKMKPLATSDLHSYLEQVTEFLNIGNPFQIEGIGTLVKTRNEQFEFTPGNLLIEKMKAPGMRELAVTSSNEQSFTGYDDFNGQNKSSILSAQQIVMILLVLGGAALAIWGGYTVYKTSGSGNQSQENNIPEITVPVTDSSLLTKTNADSIQTSNKITSPGYYKFVLETARKKRALERFAKLKFYEWNVQLETKDSTQFKIFMMLPATRSDTTRIIDSLTRLNGRKVHIEN
jgi:nucleoid DNA-binding protein